MFILKIDTWEVTGVRECRIMNELMTQTMIDYLGMQEYIKEDIKLLLCHHFMF